MKYQIAEQQIVRSDFYRNMDTTSICKNSQAPCPHKHTLQVIHSVLSHYTVKLADKSMSLGEISEVFEVSVLLQVGQNA